MGLGRPGRARARLRHAGPRARNAPGVHGLPDGIVGAGRRAAAAHWRASATRAVASSSSRVGSAPVVSITTVCTVPLNANGEA